MSVWRQRRKPAAFRPHGQSPVFTHMLPSAASIDGSEKPSWATRQPVVTGRPPRPAGGASPRVALKSEGGLGSDLANLRSDQTRNKLPEKSLRRHDPLPAPCPRITMQIVRHYRVFCLDRASRVVSAEYLEAASDAEALAAAARIGSGGRREVWTGGRLVGRIGGNRV